MAEDVVTYFQDQLLVTIVFGLLAGFLASKTVAIGRDGHLVFFLAIGLIGSFIGQFAILYLGLDSVFDHVHQFRLFFDLLAAYIGSFLLASLVHFLSLSKRSNSVSHQKYDKVLSTSWVASW